VGGKGREGGEGLAQVTQLHLRREVGLGACIEREDLMDDWRRSIKGPLAAERVEVARVLREAPAAVHVDHLIVSDAANERHADVELRAAHLKNLLLRRRRNEAPIAELGVGEIDKGGAVHVECACGLHRASVQGESMLRGKQWHVMRAAQALLHLVVRWAEDALESDHALIILRAFEQQALA